MLSRGQLNQQLRARRKRAVRSKTEPLDRMSKRQLAVLLADSPEPYQRPRRRSDCVTGLRPCPFVGCKYNLYLDVHGSGNLLLNFPDIGPEQMGESCALDIASRGGATLESVGEWLNVTRERVRQLEQIIAAKLDGSPEVERMLEALPDDAAGSVWDLLGSEDAA